MSVMRPLHPPGLAKADRARPPCRAHRGGPDAAPGHRLGQACLRGPFPGICLLGGGCEEPPRGSSCQGSGPERLAKPPLGAMATGTDLAAKTGGHTVRVTFTVTRSELVVQRGPVFREARDLAGAQGRERAGTETWRDLSWKPPWHRWALRLPRCSRALRSSVARLVPNGCHWVSWAKSKLPGGGGSRADLVTGPPRHAAINRDTRSCTDGGPGPFVPRTGRPRWALGRHGPGVGWAGVRWRQTDPCWTQSKSNTNY